MNRRNGNDSLTIAFYGVLFPGLPLIADGHWIYGMFFASLAAVTWHNLDWQIGWPAILVHVCAGLFALMQHSADRSRARVADCEPLIRRKNLPYRFRRYRH